MTAKTAQPGSRLPATLDGRRMVAERRVFAGSLPLAGMSRLREDLAETGGEARFELEFGRDELGLDEVHVRVTAELPLQCQRTLETFFHPVEVDTRLGLIDNERDEAALPPGVEPLILADGTLEPAAVIEDELLLAVPLVPMKPGSRLQQPDNAAAPPSAEEEEAVENPFAVLGRLKQEHD